MENPSLLQTCLGIVFYASAAWTLRRKVGSMRHIVLAIPLLFLATAAEAVATTVEVATPAGSALGVCAAGGAAA